MDDLEEVELPSSQGSTRIIQNSDTRIVTTDEELKYRKQLFPESKSVLKAKIQCTACGTSLMKMVNKGRDLYFHPMLQVLTCEDCRSFYGDGSFPLDDDNSDQYCRWCAQGGSLYCCSACNFVFCKACIRRNFKKSMLEEIEEEDWKCFMCNPEALWKHRAVCAAARKYVKENPGDEDDEDIDSSNDERKREKKMVAREKSRLKGKSGSAGKSERSKRNKPASRPARRSRRVESSDDDDDDEGDDDDRAKGKEMNNKGDSSSDDDEDKRRKKKKKLKERDKGQKEGRTNGKGGGLKSSAIPKSDNEDGDVEMEPVAECSTSLNQGEKNEEAHQIAVMRKTCHVMMSLAKEAFSTTLLTTKKTRKIYKWLSVKNKVSHEYLPTTPEKCTKIVKTFKAVLCELSGNIEDLQGKISEAEKDWLKIVEENNASDKEEETGKGHCRVNSESQKKDESTMMTDESRLVNGECDPPEDSIAEDETEKTSVAEDETEKTTVAEDVSQLDSSAVENVKNVTSDDAGESDTENHDGEEDLENGRASDCDKSLAVAEDEKTTNDDEGGVEDNNASCDVDMAENTAVSPDSTVENAENAPVSPDSTVEDAVNSTEKREKDSTKDVEVEKSKFENSIQDLFATDEEGDTLLNKVTEPSVSKDNEGKDAVVDKDSTVSEGDRTTTDDTKEVRVNGNEQNDDGESDAKVKPSSDDRSAKLAFLLDSSSSSDDSDSEAKSKGKKKQQSMSNGNSGDSEPVSEIESDVAGKDKISRTKNGKNLFCASEVTPRYEDEKLKAKCVVSVQKLKNDEYKLVDLKNGTKKVDSMTRAIKRLGNFTNLEKALIKSGSDSDSDEESAKKKRKVKKKKLPKNAENSLKDSSGSGAESDGSDFDKIMSPSKLDEKSNEKMLDALAAELFANSSNLESSSSDEESDGTKKKDDNKETEKKSTKKEKMSEEIEIKEEKDTSTDDDKIVSNARWKRDKLLREKLSATDSSEEERRWRKKKEKEKENTSDSDDDSDFEAPKTRKKLRKNLADSDSDVLEVSSNSVKSSDSSDFEVNKKRKRKNQSDSSSDKSTGSKVTKKKKLRRIKMLDSDSDSDIMCVEEKKEEKKKKEKEEPEKGKSHRKGRGEQLAHETRAAGKEEQERIKRISERQKLYNEIFTDVRDLEDVKELILDFDPDTKKPLVSVDPILAKKLKPHQAQGVKFMWEACFESLKRMEESDGSGCILAHCMGLGKTLQVIALVHTLLTNPKTEVHTVLVICPLNTVLNWVNEFQSWLKDLGSGEDVELYELTKYKVNVERMYQLKYWKKDGGVMILGYEMYRNLTSGKKLNKKFMQVFQSTLLDPGPDLVICDEGHLLKNIQSGLSKAVNSIKTKRRIVLTGTPLQNNLKEYHCMIQFVKPNLLGTPKEFLTRFINPITNGQSAESTPHDVRVMKRRAHVLHKMLEGCVQRQDYSVLTPFLPPKYEYVIAIQLTELQSKLYIYYLENFAQMKGGTTLFNDFQHLQRIWTHPRLLKIKAENEEKKRLLESDSEGSLKDFICDDSTTETSSSDSQSSVKKRITRSGKKPGKKKDVYLNSNSDSDIVCLSEEEKKKKESKEEDEDEPMDAPVGPKEWWESYVVPEDFDVIEHSGKLVLLFDILQKCEMIGDKVLVFSQSLLSLDVIEHFLENIDDLTQKLGTQTLEDSENTEKTNKFVGSWSKGLDYFRIDGSVSAENRSHWCKHFNRPDNLRARLFLISTRAGGMGINLIGANRVILFDASWNPSNDLQSIFRIYRFGQTKPCYVYRFLAQGTMEEKIYNRQVTKLSLALRVVDEHQIERHFSDADLQALYRYEPKQKTGRPTPILPKDRLLAELIQKYPDLIDNYHEHDSLLENKTEEELTEDERKAAWEDFENDKKGVLPAVNTQLGGVGAYGGLTPQMLYGTNMFGENAQALRDAILEMHPNATEEQIATELSLAAARINQYIGNPSYPQMQSYYDSMVGGQPMTVYGGQGPRYAQQTPFLQNQYGLQNYYHNPVMASTSFTNHNRMIHPNAYNVPPNVNAGQIQPVNSEANGQPRAKDTPRTAAPLIKIRNDLMDPSVNATDDNDIIIDTVKRREV